MTKPIIEHKIKCGRMVMLFWIVLSYAACELFVETSKPLTMNMVKGKVLNWKDNEFYIYDIGTVYKPEYETVIFVAAIGSAYENRKEWVVEADLNNFEFIRGTGKEPFTIWPEDIRRKAIKLAINAPSPQGTLEHPLA